MLAADMAEVDRVLRESLASDVALIRQVAEYIIGGGGKRLRPASAADQRARLRLRRATDHHMLAAVVEMIHTATLLHDDVVDESKLRRGHATANATFGNAATVLVGDFLYSRAFQLHGRHRLDARAGDPFRRDQRHRRRRGAAAHELRRPRSRRGAPTST